MDVLRPFHAAIDRAMAPHFQDVFEGDDPADAVQYAVDLINGAEAALRHLGRVIEMYATFEARRRTERLVKEARRDLWLSRKRSVNPADGMLRDCEAAPRPSAGKSTAPAGR